MKCQLLCRYLYLWKQDILQDIKCIAQSETIFIVLQKYSYKLLLCKIISLLKIKQQNMISLKIYKEAFIHFKSKILKKITISIT